MTELITAPNISTVGGLVASSVFPVTNAAGNTLFQATGAQIAAAYGGGGGGGISSSGIYGQTRAHLSANSGVLVWANNEVSFAYPPDYDNLGAVALAGFPMNFYVPTGITMASINAQGTFNTANTSAEAVIVSFASGSSNCRVLGGGGALPNGQFNISTGWVPVVAGDIIKLLAHPGGAGNYLLGGNPATTFNPGAVYLAPVTQFNILWGDNSVVLGGA